MENKQQLSAEFSNGDNKLKKEEMHSNIESHSLSLRKKLNQKVKRFTLPNSLSNELTYEINMPELDAKINNQELYKKFKNSREEKESLGFLFQMLLAENNDDVLKFGLANIKKYLIDIDEEIFIGKNLISEFNDKLVNYLFELLLKKVNDLYIISNISFILNKLSTLFRDKNGFFFNVLYNNFNNILNLAKKINSEEPQVKNILYLLSIKIFLSSDEIILSLEKNYPDYIPQIHQEILKLDESKFVKNMALISTLLNIINNCFFYKIYNNYFFSLNNNTNANANEINVENIFNFIRRLLNFSYQMEIFEQELRCIQNFLYLIMENEKYLENMSFKKKIQKIINDLQIEEKVIPLIFDSTVNQPGLRVIALQILVNSTNICSKRFCEKLIDNDIANQIIKLENYLINQIQITNRTRNLYQLLMDLIFNLIENESLDIIDNLSIENSCISLLFKFQKIPFYSKENKNYMIKIFNILIQSNHKYIHTLLISEGICEWYKKILEDAPNITNIEIIMTNLITMVKYSAHLVNDDNNKNNLLLIHLEKIGILEVVNSLKGRNDLSEDVMALINEFSLLFK